MELFQGNLKFSGADLKRIKSYTGHSDPNEALEEYITSCIALGVDPQSGLEMLEHGELEELRSKHELK